MAFREVRLISIEVLTKRTRLITYAFQSRHRQLWHFEAEFDVWVLLVQDNQIINQMDAGRATPGSHLPEPLCVFVAPSIALAEQAILERVTNLLPYEY